MGKSKDTINLKKQNNKKKLIKVIGILSLILILSFCVLKIMYRRQNITLQSTWQSDETGQVITFTSDGNVNLAGDLPSGIYHIISPNKMEYTVDGKTFLMIYHLEEDKLYWGLDESSLESFHWIER